MKKIKIARIVTIPFALISLLGLFDFLDKDERFEVHIISGIDPFGDILKSRYPHFKFHTVNISRKVSLIKDLRTLIDLLRIFSFEKFDIVHSLTPKAGILSALAGFLTLIPIRLHTFTGQVWVDYRGLKRIFFKGLDNFICKLNTQNFVDSPSQRQYLLDNHVGSPDKLIVLLKGSIAGINIKKFDPAKIKESSKLLRESLFPGFDGKIILYLGRINNDKGLKELGTAFLELKKKFKLKLLIVGPQESVASGLSLLLDQLKKDKDAKFIGFVSKVEEYYGVSDIYCLPSYREGCPTSVLEASAMEKPVVASNIYGISDVAIDGQTALLFEVRNAKDLELKLETLIVNEEFSRKLGLRGRQFVCEDFAENFFTEKMVAEYLRFIELV